MELPIERTTRFANQAGAATAAAMTLLALGLLATGVEARAQQAGANAKATKKDGPPPEQPKVKLGLVDQRPQGVPRLHAPEPDEQEDNVPDRHGRTRRQDMGIRAQLDARRVPAGERPSVPHRGACRRRTGLRRRAGLGRADSGVRLGRRPRLGFPVPQRQAVSPPRRRQDAQRQRAHDRLGQEDRRPRPSPPGASQSW